LPLDFVGLFISFFFQVRQRTRDLIMQIQYPGMGPRSYFPRYVPDPK